MDMTKQLKNSRGRGSSRGRGTGRGRGRGRGAAHLSKSFAVINLDDDDELCNMALEQAELENNSITKAFESLNNATELEGFDPMSGSMWIYPTNRPVRDYQFEIVKTALFNNTLVSLPTGLGKTFISAVVMYNFQRWYPTGLVVFLAPTRPLVTQQLDACHNTVGISPAKTVELTGQIAPKKREMLWKTKTVFFLTPQVMLSDLERAYFDPENVRCVVVDEAHKALGNHAYVQVIAKISQKNRLFRVLALSATPGSDLQAVKQVFKNLLISRVELRSENSLDILPYIHEKKSEKIVVKLDSYLKGVYDQMTEVFQIYTGKLMKCNALTGRDGTSYSKFQILKARETFRQTLASKIPNFQKGYIEVDFAVCISLAHSIEILISHGLRTFYIFLQGVLSKEKGNAAVTAELRKNTLLQNLLDEIKQKLNISAENSTFDFDLSNVSGLFSKVGSPRANVANRSFLQEEVDFTLSHPKLKVLKDIVQKHFLEYATRNTTTRVMIFSQYRDSVQEIGNMLNSLRPMVKPMVFIGQANTSAVGRGLKQKDQVQVVQKFREGGFNVLVATSVGEEGLDIGEVDLIICFDASKSPTRLIQRMGRTGRQREGKTVFLLTHGKEEKSYLASFSLHSSISKSITDPQKLEPFLYKQSPRMVPAGVDPTCYKLSVVLTTEQNPDHLPEPMEIDLDDEEAGPSKPIPAPVPSKSKRKQQPKTASKKKAGSEVSSNNIAKLFERMHKTSSQSQPSPRRKEGSAPVVVDTHPVITIKDDDDYGNEEGMHVHMLQDNKAFNSFSVYPKIFDTDKADKNDWKPCTTFYKSKFPPTTSISVIASKAGVKNLDKLLLDDKALAAIENSIKSRESFSYLTEDFCECGNPMEPHVAQREVKQLKTSHCNSKNHKPNEIKEKTCYNISKDHGVEAVKNTYHNKSKYREPKSVETTYQSNVQDHEVGQKANRSTSTNYDAKKKTNHSNFVDYEMKGSTLNNSKLPEANPYHDNMDELAVLDEPFIEEEFDMAMFDIPDNFFDDSPPKAVDENASCNTPCKKTTPPQMTPPKECSSDDEIRSQYSASPEVGQNRFLERLKALKLRKAQIPQVVPEITAGKSSLSRGKRCDDIFKISSTSYSRPSLDSNKQNSKRSEKKDDDIFKTSSTSYSRPSLDTNKQNSKRSEKVDDNIFKTSSTSYSRTSLDINKQNSKKSEKVDDGIFKTSSTSRLRTSLDINKQNSKRSKKVDDDIFKTSSTSYSRPSLGTNKQNSKRSEKVDDDIFKASSTSYLRTSLDTNKQNSKRSEKVDNEMDNDIFKNSSTSYSRTSLNTNKQTSKQRLQEPDDDIFKTSSTSCLRASLNTNKQTPKQRIQEPDDDISIEYCKLTSSAHSTVKFIGDNSMTETVAAPVVPTKKFKFKKKTLATETVHLEDPKPRIRENSPSLSPILNLPSSGRRPPRPLSRIRNPPRTSLRISDPMSPTRDFRSLSLRKPKPLSPVLNFRSPEREQRESLSPILNLPAQEFQEDEPLSPILNLLTSEPWEPEPLSPLLNLPSSSRREPSASVKCNLFGGDESPYVLERNTVRPKQKKDKRNPYIASQADASGSETSFEDENEFEYEGLDDMDDSFVTNDGDDTVTHSQQAMYLESVKDSIPAKFGRIEKPLSPRNYGSTMDETGEGYEDDSFCQGDDNVEYMDVGAFTQAMNIAKVEIAVGNSGRQTRRGKRDAKPVQKSGTSRGKQRKRIVVMDDSSDDDDDFK